MSLKFYKTYDKGIVANYNGQEMPVSKVYRKVLFKEGPSAFKAAKEQYDTFVSNVEKIDSAELVAAEVDAYEPYDARMDDFEYTFRINGHIIAERNTGTSRYGPSSLSNMQFTQEEQQRLDKVKEIYGIEDEINWGQGYFSINGYKVPEHVYETIEAYTRGGNVLDKHLNAAIIDGSVSKVFESEKIANARERILSYEQNREQMVQDVLDGKPYVFDESEDARKYTYKSENNALTKDNIWKYIRLLNAGFVISDEEANEMRSKFNTVLTEIRKEMYAFKRKEEVGLRRLQEMLLENPWLDPKGNIEDYPGTIRSTPPDPGDRGSSLDPTEKYYELEAEQKRTIKFLKDEIVRIETENKESLKNVEELKKQIKKLSSKLDKGRETQKTVIQAQINELQEKIAEENAKMGNAPKQIEKLKEEISKKEKIKEEFDALKSVVDKEFEKELKQVKDDAVKYHTYRRRNFSKGEEYSLYYYYEHACYEHYVEKSSPEIAQEIERKHLTQYLEENHLFASAENFTETLTAREDDYIKRLYVDRRIENQLEAAREEVRSNINYEEAVVERAISKFISPEKNKDAEISDR